MRRFLDINKAGVMETAKRNLCPGPLSAVERKM